MTDLLPIRPASNTLDAYYAANHGAQNPRYSESANGVIDNALNAFNGDKNYPAIDQSSVSPVDVAAAEAYLADVEAYIKLHGGFWPANDQPAAGDHTDVSSLTSPAPSASAPVTPVAAPVAPVVTITAEAHQQSAGILERIRLYLNSREQALVDELRVLWKHA